jgi:hypothetical protein
MENTMQAPTREEIEAVLKKSLETEYLRLRKQVRESGMRSLTPAERKFYMEYPNNF